MKDHIDILSYIDIVYTNDGERYEVTRAITTEDDEPMFICTCVATGDTVMVNEEELVSFLF